MKTHGLVNDCRSIYDLRELYDGSCEMFGERPAFLYNTKDGVETVTYNRSHSEAVAIAEHFRSLGLEGKIITLIGKNCYHWALTYLLVTCGVGVIMPLDKELKADELKGLLELSGSSAIVYTPEQSEKVESIETNVIKLPTELFSQYIEKGSADIEAAERGWKNHKIDAKGMGILLYTSGTTGVAKGVMLSQYGICQDIVGVLKGIKFTEEDRVLSVLPLHHTYESMAGFLSPLYIGASIAYNDSLKRLQSDMKTFSPTVLIAVPLLLETFRNAILKKYSKMNGGKTILALQRGIASSFSRTTEARKKLFSQVNSAFGGRLRLVLCGAAKLSPEVAKDYELFGVQILVGYGLTETSPVCLCHTDWYRAPDDIGRPIPGVQAKLVDENEEGVGELAVRGANVMLGYFNNPEETEKVLRDGWFYTGDLAKKKPNGAYQITGRIKSMIVTQNGKKIFPEEVEYYLDKTEAVVDSLVYGAAEGDECIVTAVIYPNYEYIDALPEIAALEKDSEEYDKAVEAHFKQIVNEVNGKLPSFKMIKRITIRKSEFIKTTTKKIKRFEPDNKLAQ